MSIILESARAFSVWAYSISHSVLLIRSVPQTSYKTRVDIVFKDVKSMHLDIEFNGIKLLQSKSIENDNIFEIESRGFSGYVKSSSINIFEELAEYHDPVSWDFVHAPGLVGRATGLW